MACLELRLGRQKQTSLSLRMWVPSPLRAASHRTQGCTERLSLLGTARAGLLRAPISCFSYPVMLYLLCVSDCSSHFLLTGGERDCVCGCFKSGFWSQACKSWILPTFFFQFYFWFCFHFRDLWFSLHP